jgi:hypothetical protein
MAQRRAKAIVNVGRVICDHPLSLCHCDMESKEAKSAHYENDNSPIGKFSEPVVR